MRGRGHEEHAPAVFDRATDMRNCVMKPLRCELEWGAQGGAIANGLAWVLAFIGGERARGAAAADG